MILTFLLIASVVIADLTGTTYPNKEQTFTVSEKQSLSQMKMMTYRIEDTLKPNMTVRCIYKNESMIIQPTARNKLTKPKTVWIETKVRCYGGTSISDLDTKEQDIVRQEIDRYESTKNKTSTIIGTGKVNIK